MQFFLSALNKLAVNRKSIKEAFDEIRDTLYSTETMEAELETLEAEMAIAAEQVTRSIRENAAVAQDQDAYNARHNALCDHYEKLKDRYSELQATITDKQTRRAAIEDFLTELMKQKDTTTEFDPMTYHILVDRMTVYAKDKVIVRFRNGIEIES